MFKLFKIVIPINKFGNFLNFFLIKNNIVYIKNKLIVFDNFLVLCEQEDFTKLKYGKSFI